MLLYFLLLRFISLICSSQHICRSVDPVRCTGPYRIRRSHNSQGQCEATDENTQKMMQQCLETCMADNCCRAFGVLNGACVTSPLYTEIYQFEKEVIHDISVYWLLKSLNRWHFNQILMW